MSVLPLLLALLAPHPCGSLEVPEPPQGPTEERIREAWSFLLPDERREVAEWFRLELSSLETFQLTVIRFVLDGQEMDPGFWPEDEPPPFYDPEVHAPGLPIARRRLAEDDRAAIRAREEILGTPLPDRLRSAWRYDWASGGLRRTGDPSDPELVFENALRGYPPDLDLARELVLAVLDAGEERPALTAFSHAYTDREGAVYPGITLFDAWSSGRKMEMPDVDTLGIVHDVLDEWRKWKSPVPATKHDSLYERIEEIYDDARHYRQLRESLADTFAMGKPPLGEYAPNVSRFHTLWNEHASTPASLAATLPDSKRWKRFMEDLVRDVSRDEKRFSAGIGRQQTLVANGRVVRGTFLRVLTEFGAFERDELPKPDPPKKRDGKGEGSRDG